MKKVINHRLFPLDALRGLIIVFMALDHANYYIAQQHSTGEHWGGDMPSYHSALPALTRFVTHLSAPGFFFLMGMGIMLFAESRRKQGWNDLQIISHFWIRGAVLVVLQLLVINSIWKAGPGFFPDTYIGVLIALGGTMILASLFLRLNPIALLSLTFVLLIGTEFLHPAPVMWGELINEPWNLILIRSGGDGTLWSNYPILPWLELVIFGMLYGHWLRADKNKAYQNALWLGIALLMFFVILRYFDGFGNIRPRVGNTWIDFLNVVKYPPSMVFTFLTVGFNLLILWGFSKANELAQTISRPLVVLGSEPLLMYVLHLVLYMLVGKLITPAGTSIPTMLSYWLLGLAFLYPLTLWYGRFKKARSPQFIWRFL